MTNLVSPQWQKLILSGTVVHLGTFFTAAGSFALFLDRVLSLSFP